MIVTQTANEKLRPISWRFWTPKQTAHHQCTSLLTIELKLISKLSRAVQANPESTSGSESSSDSDSDSEDEVPYVRKRPRVEDFIMDDDEEGAAAVVSPEQMRTKNEVASVPVVIPDIEQVDEHETLEKVGEVLSIVDKVVIVEGLPPQPQAGGLDRALDSDTLLVFEDRKVLGYVSIILLLNFKPRFPLNEYFLGLGNVWPDYTAILSGTLQRGISSRH